MEWEFANVYKCLNPIQYGNHVNVSTTITSNENKEERRPRVEPNFHKENNKVMITENSRAVGFKV